MYFIQYKPIIDQPPMNEANRNRLSLIFASNMEMIIIFIDSLDLHFIKPKLPWSDSLGVGRISKVTNLSLIVALKLFRVTNIINYQKPSLLQKELTPEIFARSASEREVLSAAAARQQVFSRRRAAKFLRLMQLRVFSFFLQACLHVFFDYKDILSALSQLLLQIVHF